MDINLTQGAVEDLVEGRPVNDPVLQLVDTLQITKGSGPTRYRVRMSDGRHLWSAFLLATQLNHLSEENLLVPHCVCLLKKTTTNTLSDGRRVVIILDMEILQSAEKTGGLIGNPTTYKERSKSSPEEPTSAAQLGNSSDNSRAAFSPRGGGTASPMKTSAEKPSPSKFSPSEASSSKFSPMKGSSFKFSPAKASSSTFSPAKASPTTFSPAKASPSTFSPAKGSPAKFSPAKASSSTFSPAKGSPAKFAPTKASPSTFSPAKASTSKFSPVKGSPSKFSPTKASSSSPGASSNMIPIAQLNPYQSKWTIRARVMNKSSIRNWNNSRGEGKLFSFEIVDESGEMKITAFNKEVDKFFSLVEQGKVYYISKATLKVANKQYNTLKHDYEMTLHAHSSIVPCADGQDIPAVQCDFVPIAELENRDKDAIIDVIGVCKTAEDVSRITTKSSREVSKRTLHLIDTTGKMVAATLWGEEAEKFEGSEQPVVAIKGARLSDFGGRSLSALFSSTVMVNPDIPEAFRLRAWYDQRGYALASQSLSETKSGGSGMRMNWKTLSDVKNENMGHGEKADYFSCVATLLYSRKDTCLYQACPSVDCNKKVLDQHNGWFRCEKCNREFPNFKYRLLLSANLADFGDNQWVTCFQETAEALLGHSAETLGQLRDTDEAAFDAVFQKANFTTHIFKNRVKLETYNDESRVKVTVMEVQPVNHREYSRMLLSNIHNLTQ